MRKQLEQPLVALERTLRSQLVAHERLSKLLDQKRQAVCQADQERMAQLCELENQEVREIGDLEKVRLQQVADLTLLMDPDAAKPMKLGELAELLPEPQRGRLLVFRQQLCDRMLQTQTQSRTTRQATELLMQHMAGLLQKVSAVCTGVSVYSAKGAPPKQAMAVSTFSLTA